MVRTWILGLTVIFVFYNQTNEQYDTNVLKKAKYGAAGSSRRKRQQVHC
jgi:hypothetical protein